MSIERRVKTVHRVDEGGWGCTGIALWLTDPFIAGVYGRDEPGWWCDCESRMRQEEI